MAKKIYKTMQGREIDMDALTTQHETMPAVGNAKMNARGDQLGAGGKIIKTRESSVAEYYEHNPNAVPREAVKKVQAPTPPNSEPVKQRSAQESKRK